ncbi:MAG: hypothetical protein HQK56_16860, partial [Deltaproteobacteria bacterium]|nr:hypothetical protein [Deltaproteobacteria bacterium]
MKRLDHLTHPDMTDHPLEPPLCFQALGRIVSDGHLIHMTSPSFFAGDANLKPELFHGLTHERGEIGRLKLLARGMGRDLDKQLLVWTYYFNDREK